jgi:hypothetical protein
MGEAIAKARAVNDSGDGNRVLRQTVLDKKRARRRGNLWLGGFMCFPAVSMFLPAGQLGGHKMYATRLRYRLVPRIW